MHLPELLQQWKREEEFQTHHPDFTSLQRSPKWTYPSALESMWWVGHTVLHCFELLQTLRWAVLFQAKEMDSQLVKIWCHTEINGDMQEYICGASSPHIGFFLREVRLNNISLHSEIIALTTKAACWNFGGPSRAPQHPRQRGGAGSERRRRANPPCAAVLVCSHHRENHLFHLERGLVPRALPPHPGSVPSCRVLMSSEGMNLLR